MKKFIALLLTIFVYSSVAFAIPNNYKDELKRIGYQYNVKGFIESIRKDNPLAFRYFLHSTVDVDSQNKRGVTPLVAAVLYGNEYYIKELIEVGKANPNIKTDVGDSALNYAAYNGNFDLVEYLIRNGAFVDNVNMRGDSPLMQSVFVNRYDIAMYLLFVGADPNLKNIVENTALHYAASYGYLEMVKVLVANGADINAQNALLETPLFIASKNGQTKVVEYLLSTRKVDKKLQNSEGLYPFDIALLKEHSEIVNLLSK